MKNNFLLIVLSTLLMLNCKESKQPIKILPIDNFKAIKEIQRSDFQVFIDSFDAQGAILVFDESQNTYYSNDFEHSKKGFLPASTFKIPNSIIALEMGVVEDEKTLIKWDGNENEMKIWNEDMTFKEAFHRSCVPCYRQFARTIGVDSMRHYLELLEYQKMDVKSENIDLFWLLGASRISQMEQIDFLQRFYHEKLPISQRTYTIAKDMMLVEDTLDYKMLAKTGFSSEANNGWYVGYVEKNNKVYYFATNIFPKGKVDFKTRKALTMAVLNKMEILPH